MYTAHIHFHSLHFYNPPKTFCLYVEATIRKRVGAEEATGENEHYGRWGGGTQSEGNPHLSKVLKYRSLSLFCSSLFSVRLLLSKVLSGPDTVAHVYVIP